MKNLTFTYPFLLSIIVMSFFSCSKNNTQYYGDDKDTGIAIFSNKGFNTMSCYANASPWYSIERIEGGLFSSKKYEVYVSVLAGINGQDTLQISWLGNYASIPDSFQNRRFIILKLVVPHSFSYRDFASFEGKRLHIDGTNGYFSSQYENNFNPTILRSTGNIYFNKAQLDSIAAGNNIGKISGLLDADINEFKITNGRFDDELDGINARLAR